MTNEGLPSTAARSAIILAAIAGTLGVLACSAGNTAGDIGYKSPSGTGGDVARTGGGADGWTGARTGVAGVDAGSGGGLGGSGTAGGAIGWNGGNLGNGGVWSAAGGGHSNGGNGSGAIASAAGASPGRAGSVGSVGSVGSAGSVGSGGSAGQAGAIGDSPAPPLKVASFVFVPSTAAGSRLADMNGDGMLDLLGLDSATGGRVTLMLGHGDGTFGPISTVGLGVESFAVGDLDGDTIPDLVTTSANSPTGTPADAPGRLEVFTNQGDATFSAPVQLLADSRTHSVLIADVDGDGRLDIAAGCDISLLDIFVNKGGGQFAPKVSYVDSGPAPGRPPGSLWALQIAAGDLNGDGATDLALVFGDIGKLTFLVNRGDGTYPTSLTLPTPGFDRFLVSPHSVALADMNGDGKADFVVGGREQGGQIFLTTAADPATPDLGSVLNPGDVLGVVDMNGDGHRDVVLSDGRFNALFLGGGDGIAGEHVSIGPYIATAVGDVNGDGKPDLVVAGGVLLNTTP